MTRAALDRYDLDLDGALLRPLLTTSDERLSLPVERVQGAVAMPSIGLETRSFVLSASYGDAPSRLVRGTSGTIETLVATLPPGIEALDAGPDGTLWFASESGAREYQKRVSAPWTHLMPYVVGFRP